jgi:hypothetical protein
MIRSACLCGNVTWEVGGPLQFMSHCHCARCRKTHGAAFATLVAAPARGFRLRGADHVVRWQSSAALARCFCGRCGAVVPGDPWEGLIFIPAGNFANDPGVRPLSHIFVASKAPWYDIHDDLVRFDEYPPGVDVTTVPDRPPLDPAGGIRGSCACAGVTFVAEGTPVGSWNCHCSRCRKGRSAAHASNLFVPLDAVRYTRGEDLLVSYKVPAALRFTQIFCRRCGSLLPFRNPARGVAVIPMGALDDDPGMRPQAHIFVASKAPWFEIADDLPQYAESLS